MMPKNDLSKNKPVKILPATISVGDSLFPCGYLPVMKKAGSKHPSHVFDPYTEEWIEIPYEPDDDSGEVFVTDDLVYSMDEQIFVWAFEALETL